MRESALTTSSFSSGNVVRKRIGLRQLVFVVCGFGILLFSLWYWMQPQSVFLTTSSPDHTYLVKLKGNKGRAFIKPSEVTVDVLKMGTVLISDVYLHSASNAFDLSFEAGFPDVRWLNNNVVEFYRSQYFEKGSDSLILENKAGAKVKWLRIQSENKFLVFDLQSGASISLKIPSTRTDTQWIGLEGAFEDGKAIAFYSKSFDRHSSQKTPFTYQVTLSDSGSLIANNGSNGGETR